MVDKTPRNLYRYFNPIRRAALRDLSNANDNLSESIKCTPKTSFIQPTCANASTRKRTYALQFSSAVGAKRKCLQVPEESVSENSKSAVSSASKEEEAGCSSNSKQLPDVLHVVYSLETVPRPQISSAAFNSISAEILVNLLTTMSDEEFCSKFFLVDCRYPYEFNGGHVKYAVNIHDPNDIGRVFFPSDVNHFSIISQKIPIFYCEFSQKRGPSMAHSLRAIDRSKNEDRYPDVDYKEIYVIDRGYNNFYQVAKTLGLCEPSAYVKMSDASHSRELRKYNLHRSRACSSLDMTISKNRSQFMSRCRRNRLHYMNPWSSRSCPAFEKMLPDTKTEEDAPVVLFSQKEKEEPEKMCILEELDDFEGSPTHFHQLNLSGNFEEDLVP